MRWACLFYKVSKKALTASSLTHWKFIVRSYIFLLSVCHNFWAVCERLCQWMRRYFTKSSFRGPTYLLWFKDGNSPPFSEFWCFLLYTWILLWLLLTSASSLEMPKFLWCEFCTTFRKPNGILFYFTFEFFPVITLNIDTKLFSLFLFWCSGDKVPLSFPFFFF